MFSGAIASFESGSAPALSSGLGLPHGCGGAERTDPVGFFRVREGGRRGLGLGADCRFLLRDWACDSWLCPAGSPSPGCSRTSESLIERVYDSSMEGGIADGFFGDSPGLQIED